MSILALHGFTGCGADFAPFAQLCGGEWHCPELPGHELCGLSICSTTVSLSNSGRPEAMTEFISEQRATLNTPESSPHILLGYSMGARAALLHATQFPEAWDALILISANPGIEDETMRTQRRSADADLADSIERGGVDTFLEYWQQTPLIRSQQNIPADWLVAMQANRQKHKAEGLANSLRQFGQGSFPNLWPSLPKLKMPICLVSGTLDTKYTRIGERMLPSFDSPRTTHLAIDGASHMPHLEQAEETALAIRSFLEQA